MTVDSVLSQSDAILAEIRPSVRGFVEDRIRAEWITCMNEDGEFDASLVDAFASQGLLGMRIDSEYGGAGLGLYEYCIAQEEVSRRHPVLSILLSSTSGLTPMAIQKHGTKAQKDKYLRPMTTGQSRTSFALTEPEAGADAASLATRAERTEDGWKLNGVKHFISGAESSDLFLVLASTTPGKRGRGITAFLVESDAPGFAVASIDHTFGSPAWTLGELVFTDCLVSEDAVLGEVDAGFDIARQALDEGRLSVASICVGAADGMLSAACDYAQTRHTFGDYLANRQSIQWMIADSATEIAAARALIQSALLGLLEEDDIGARASMAKLFASEMAGRVADRAVQIHGAMGVVADSEVGRTFRDLRVFRIGEGPSEVQRMIIARDRLRRGDR